MSAKGLIVVMGAGSGIGKATAEMLLEKGYPVLLVGNRMSRISEMESPRAMLAEADVTDHAAFARAVALAEERFGPVSGLVNNAGVMLLGRIESQDPSDWKRTLDRTLEPNDIARCVLFALEQPPHVCIREIVVAATTQEP